MPQKLPKFLQPFLWSVRIDELDFKKDKIYIIHQILAFGDMKAIDWLFKNYSLEEIKNVFLNHSMKIYRGSAFNFVKNIILDTKKQLNSEKYVAASF